MGMGRVLAGLIISIFLGLFVAAILPWLLVVLGLDAMIPPKTDIFPVLGTTIAMLGVIFTLVLAKPTHEI